METTTSLKTFEVTIPEKYADILKKFITSLEGKVKAQKKFRIGRGLGGREGRKDLSCGKHKGFDETNPRLMKYSINYTKKFKKNLRLCPKKRI